jgi:RHS repeat-associated protein
MMAYDEGGVTKDFLTDHLGSITAEINQAQARTYDTRYSAYGRNNWSTGTGCGFGWVGSYGYRETGLFHMSHYVRARHYSYLTGAWSTVDPLWPSTSAYGYVLSQPTWLVDPAGLQGKPAIPPWLMPPAPRPKNLPVQGPPVPWIFPFPPVASPPHRKGRPVPHRLPWTGSNHLPGTGWSYGSYCGQSTIQNPGLAVLPQDDLDACCQTHDRCLEAHYGAGYGNADAHICCDGSLLTCAKWVVSTGCKKAPGPWRESQCIEASLELITGIEIALGVMKTIRGLQNAREFPYSSGPPPCIDPRKWPRLVEKHWGDPETTVPKGCGTNS